MNLWLVVLLASHLFAADASSGSSPASDKLTSTKLSNGIIIPLVGLGIGNLPHEQIPSVVHNSLQPDVDIRLVDTAHASRNEGILAKAIVDSDTSRQAGANNNKRTRGSSGNNIENPPPIHVVTKVWYTHLGYERTKRSVEESLKALQAVNTRQVYVHMLLHWPRCNDDIPWMNCDEEENNLPQYVKDVGPAPHLEIYAWKDSWKALEELYVEHSHRKKTGKTKPILASIGVSNFELEDMTELLEIAKISPHLYQGNSWKVFHDPYLMTLLRDNNVFFQAYGVMNGILHRMDESPVAFNMLSDISRELASSVDASEGYESQSTHVITEATVLLAHLVNSDIGVIPRASSSAHQHENSPSSLSKVIPHLTATHIQQLQKAVPALMKGETLNASISFSNSLPGPIQIHWIHPETKEEMLVAHTVHSGQVEVIQSHPGHRFVAYDTEREVRKEVVVDVGYGERQHYSVEL